MILLNVGTEVTDTNLPSFEEVYPSLLDPEKITHATSFITESKTPLNTQELDIGSLNWEGSNYLSTSPQGLISDSTGDAACYFPFKQTGSVVIVLSLFEVGSEHSGYCTVRFKCNRQGTPYNDVSLRPDGKLAIRGNATLLPIASTSLQANKDYALKVVFNNESFEVWFDGTYIGEYVTRAETVPLNELGVMISKQAGVIKSIVAY